MSEWIPVSERLPEDDCEVLVATWMRLDGKQHIDIAAFRRGTGQFNFNLTTVTHWQPLPEPPKG